VISILRLVRFKNLLIIALTQYAMRYLVVSPMLKRNGFELQLDGLHFLLLVLSAVFITAAGYVINDYFDTKTDMLNRPETVLVGRKISRRAAMALHIVLNAFGVLLGLYLSVYIGILAIGVAYIMAAGLLWFYSTSYKRQFLIGNVLVAFFTAVVPFLVVVFEVPLLNQAYRDILIENNMSFNNILAWVGGFSYFAFLSTLIREIIKDVEDYEGDLAYGRNSVPIVLGIRTSRHVIGFLVIFLLGSMVYLYIRYLRFVSGGKHDLLTLAYLVFFLFLPYIYLIYRIYNAQYKQHYHRCSTISKLIMLAGILYSVIIWVILHTNHG
jgi:4-hydroxybenzoate polyprenyltransferase